MVKVVKDNGIEMTRGDTLLLRVKLEVDGAPYQPVDGDKIRFAMKTTDMDFGRTRYRDNAPLIRKDIDPETMLLRLDPEDTKGLPFGEYVYDVQLTRLDGFVRTFIARARLMLREEVD